VVLADGFSCRAQLARVRAIHLTQLLASRLPDREQATSSGGIKIKTGNDHDKPPAETSMTSDALQAEFHNSLHRKRSWIRLDSFRTSWLDFRNAIGINGDGDGWLE
jgi:hypothetical protein